MKKIYLSTPLYLILLLLIFACTNDEKLIKKDEPNFERLTYQQVIEKVKTPSEAAYYLKSHLYYKSPPNGTYSFEYIHRLGYGDCSDYSVAAAALLSDDGYPPLILGLFFNEYILHACYVYQDEKTKKWGILGLEEDNTEAIFENLEEICSFMEKKHKDFGKCLLYILYDISKYNFIDPDSTSYIYPFWGWDSKAAIKKVILDKN